MHEEPGITFRSVKSSAPKSAWGNNARTEEERLQTIWLIPAPWLEEKRWYPSNIHKGTQLRHTRRNPGAHGGGKKKSTCRGKCLSDPSTARTEGQQGETAEHRGAARADATPLLGRVGQGAKEHQHARCKGLPDLTLPLSQKPAEGMSQFLQFSVQGSGRGSRKGWTE